MPANTKIGLSQGEVARRGWAVTTAEFARAIDRSDVAIVDIRETNEQEEEGAVLGALHVPYAMIAKSLKPRGLLHQAGSPRSSFSSAPLGNALRTILCLSGTG